MKTLVSVKLDIVLKSNKISAAEISTVKGYIEASKFYESLIASGITTHRGNNLLSREEALASTIKFNYSI